MWDSSSMKHHRLSSHWKDSKVFRSNQQVNKQLSDLADICVALCPWEALASSFVSLLWCVTRQEEAQDGCTPCPSSVCWQVEEFLLSKMQGRVHKALFISPAFFDASEKRQKVAFSRIYFQQPLMAVWIQPSLVSLPQSFPMCCPTNLAFSIVLGRDMPWRKMF